MTDGEITDVVRRALRGEESLDALVERRLFGDDPPETAAEWTQEQWWAWGRAVHAFVTELRERSAQAPARLALDRAWAAVEASQGTGSRKALTWTSLARYLKTSPRSANHQLTLLGFTFSGRTPNRALEDAPCIRCGCSEPAASMKARTCKRCLSLTDVT